MPTNLTDASSWDQQTAPLAGDVRNAASMQTALQTAANRARWLYDRTTPLADIAALKAIVAPADGLVRLVERFGFYIFDGASAATESLPWIVQPTTGTGRWLHSLHDIAGAANGLANLDGSALVPLAQLPAGTPSGLATLDGGGKLVEPVPNAVLALAQPYLASAFATSSTSYVDVTGLSATVAGGKAGDIIAIDAFLEAFQSGSGGLLKLVAVDAGGTFDLGSFTGAPTVTSNVMLQAVHTVTADGSVTLKVRAKVTTGTLTVSGNASTSYPQSKMRLLYVRP